MLYFANPCGPAVIAAMKAGVLGYIDTPAQGNKRPEGVTWCLDNGCGPKKNGQPGELDEQKWWRTLANNAYAASSCLFAVAPDVVGDAEATLDRSRPWLPKIRALGYPAALVAQDGLEHLEIPWDEFDCLFIGGTTEWKLSPAARDLCHEAKQRGKWVHVGRVNSGKRYAYAAMPYEHGGMGADSADGTYLTFGPDINLPKLLGWGFDLFSGATA